MEGGEETGWFVKRFYRGNKGSDCWRNEVHDAYCPGL